MRYTLEEPPGAYIALRPACLVLNLYDRYLRTENILKKTCGSIAIQAKFYKIISLGGEFPRMSERFGLGVRLVRAKNRSAPGALARARCTVYRRTTPRFANDLLESQQVPRMGTQTCVRGVGNDPQIAAIKRKRRARE